MSNKDLLLRILDDLSEPTGYKSLTPYDPNDPEMKKAIRSSSDHSSSKTNDNSQVVIVADDPKSLTNLTSHDVQMARTKPGLYGILFETRKSNKVSNTRSDNDDKRPAKVIPVALKASQSILHDNYHSNGNDFDDAHEDYEDISKIIYYDRPESLSGGVSARVASDGVVDEDNYSTEHNNNLDDYHIMDDDPDAGHRANHNHENDDHDDYEDRLINDDQRKYGLIDPMTMVDSIAFTGHKQQILSDCSINVLLFKARKYDDYGNHCSALVRFRVCSGSCVTSEHGEPKIPFIAKSHASCNFVGSIKRHIRLQECSSQLIDEKSSLRDYHYVEPLGCTCKSCNRTDNECLTTNSQMNTKRRQQR